ncbi:hypothetical protein [Ferrimonas lipolytica]|uniref:Hook-length control protein FliK n=1 Tax=Ferrimonas lipolytica TaxID=2724191 RepID=A0A6H1UA08_9GAMM|nr:hypothetical protein [Ferrimonas lipolytica]QIZ75658.1 hypothetical protein HER31_01310 [Ferrimonas lipolytica]
MEIKAVVSAPNFASNSAKVTLAATNIHHGQLQLGTNKQLFQVPATAGPYLANGEQSLRPLKLKTTFSIPQLAPQQQQLLTQQLPNPQTLIPVQITSASTAQLVLAGSTISLAVALPLGQWLVQRHQQQLRLFQVGQPIQLIPIAASNPNLTHTQPTLSSLSLPSLAQLAQPSALAAAIAQIGRFPFDSKLEGPLGNLARQWLSQFEPHSSLSELVKALHQYQQQSQADPEQAQLYLALPYQQQQQQRQLQLSLKQYRSHNDAKQPSWLLALQFELELGVLRGNVRWQDGEFTLELLCSSHSLTEAAQQHLAALQQRLTVSGLPLAQLHCRQAKITTNLSQPEQHYGR